MTWQETPYTVTLFVAAAAAVASALYVWSRQWRRQRLSGSLAAALLLALCAEWTLAQAMEISSADLPSKLLWVRFRYLGMAAIPPAWLIFTLQYTGRESWVTRRNELLLSLLPALTALLFWTNDTHGLIWRSAALDTTGPFPMLKLSHGPWYWVHVLYSYSLLLAGTFLLVQLLLRSRHMYRWQASALIFAVFLPWLANLLYPTFLNPFPRLDPTAMAFSVVSLALAWSLSGLRVGDIMSVSRGAVPQIMSDGVLVLDGQDRVVYLNPAAEGLLGCPISRAAGRPVQQLWPNWPEQGQGGAGLDGQGREAVLEKDGETRIYDLRLSIQRDWRGRVVSQVGVVRDVTGRKQVEVRREEHIKDLAFLSRTAMDLVESSPEKDLYQFIGDGLTELLGKVTVAVLSFDPSAERFTLRSLAGVGDKVEAIMKLLGRDPVGLSFPILEETRAVLVSGKLNRVAAGMHELSSGLLPRHVCTAIERLLHLGEIYLMGVVRKGELLGAVSVITRSRTDLRNPDIVETFVNQTAVALLRERAEEALRQSEEQLLRAQRLETAGRIAGQVAHDFNNLLGPLTAYPELIKMQLPEGHGAGQYCDAMLEAAERMAEINEDMMALGRRGHFDQQPIHLGTLAQQTVEQIANLPDAMEVRLEQGEDLFPIVGSDAQLSRVLSNLISNARDAMQDSGTITVATENVYVDQPQGNLSRVAPGEYVRLRVIDTGSGIPLEIQAKIFDPFFSTKTKVRRQGCGLGLSIVQSIVNDHKGYLDLESEVGKGTTFSVYLPIARDTVPAEEPRQGLRGGKETILVVDDDRLQREVVVQLLTSLGYQVESLSSGEEAVACLSQNRVDLLILDMIMPGGIDGAETYRQVIETRPGQPVIIVSGFSESERVRAVLELGTGSYLRKPVTRQKLAAAVRAQLDRRGQVSPSTEAPALQ